MAGNRVHKFGTILTRVEGLLRSGAIAEESAPIWMSVYKAFPPHVEPKLSRPVPDQTIRDIVYAEDYIRARFYEKFGSVGVIDNTIQVNKNYKTISQTFIDRYIQIAKTSEDLNDDQLFEKTEQTLTREGIIRLKPAVKQTVSVENSYQKTDLSHKKLSISEIVLSSDELNK